MDANTMGDQLVFKLRSTNFDMLGFDDREKEELLNLAQDEFTKSRVIPDLNVKGKGIEADSKRKLDLSGLMTAHTSFKRIRTGLNGDFMLGTEDNGALRTPDRDRQSESILTLTENVVESNFGIFCRMPDEALFITSENCDTSKGTEVKIGVPIKAISYEEYEKGLHNRFKQPWGNMVWRLEYGSYTTSGTLSSTSSKYTGALLTGFTGKNADGSGGDITINTHRSALLIPGKDWVIEAYNMRYVKRPSRIVLDTITPANQKNCELHPSVHDEVVGIAVRLAISSKIPEQAKYQIADKEEKENE